MKTELRVTRVGTKGQVVIPNEFRAALKLEAGDVVIVQLEGSRVVFEKRHTTILSLVGKYATPTTTSGTVSAKRTGEEGEPRGA